MNLKEEIETALEKFANGGTYPINTILKSCKNWALEMVGEYDKDKEDMDGGVAFSQTLMIRNNVKYEIKKRIRKAIK